MRNTGILTLLTAGFLLLALPETAVVGLRAAPPATAVAAGAATAEAAGAGEAEAAATEEESAAQESQLISKVRQLTFAGRRSGEGYFSADGQQMVFQSEREPGNPFYQIYRMDLQTGDIARISPGIGKTTCAWIHPEGDRVLFASTQDDPEAKEKQKAERELRASGKERRYAWDYDPEFEIFAWDASSGDYTQLTDAFGYDAEGSYSPDGSKVAFASNRQAYERELSDREKQLFEVDPASMIELYIMDADGSNVRRLTDAIGYDGGPFFSPDGQRICWRRFSEDGATAEIYTMRIDGTDVRRLTELGAMSWAPFFHPSNDYLIFTTNKHGFANFELYLVRADGEGELVRVTTTDGFDGLPVFTPDGEHLSWTSTRGSSGRSQIYMADWDDAAARRLLGLNSASDDSDRLAALKSARSTTAGISAADIGRHVDYLTREELGGRLTGTPGERRATAYVAAYLESIGLEPAGENGTWYQEFSFPAGAELTDANRLTSGDKSYQLDEQWRPLSFSGSGEFDPAELVFAGYGMSVPKSEGQDEYDSYVHLDVNGKWVVVLRDLPQSISPERRQQMARYSTPRRKAALARDLGARGIVFVAGPTSKVRNELIRFDEEASQAGVSIAVLSVTNAVAGEWFQQGGKNLQAVQQQFDDGSPQMGFTLKHADSAEPLKLSARVGILRKTGTGRNVIGRLRRPATGEAQPAKPMVILGAHIDHLGVNGGSSSLATEEERGQVHVGADDNASGVAAILEVAQSLATQQAEGDLQPRRDLLVAAWSGEELGLFGSQAFVESFDEVYPDAPVDSPRGNATETKDAAEPQGAADNQTTVAHSHGHSPAAQALTDRIAAYINLDMVGRLREKLIVQGIGSSPHWEAEVQRRNVPVGLSLELDKASTRLPTDAAAFVSRNVPILTFFTGAHEDYHTPRDTADKLNYEGAAEIAKLTALVVRGVLTAERSPPFELNEGEQASDAPRVRLTAYLGTIPDYAAGDIKGLKLSGVANEGPAAEAGLQGGDVIVELAGRTIENIYDYTYAIEALKIGETVKVVVMRDDKRRELEITPGSRE